MCISKKWSKPLEENLEKKNEKEIDVAVVKIACQGNLITTLCLKASICILFVRNICLISECVCVTGRPQIENDDNFVRVSFRGKQMIMHNVIVQ